MGKVTYAPGIQYVNGSLAKPKKVNGHNHGDYLIGTHRTAATTNPNCTRLYIRKADSYERTTPLTTNESANRARFAGIAALIKARKEDLSQASQDLTNFLAQRDNADGKKTLTSYYWMICGDEYDANH